MYFKALFDTFALFEFSVMTAITELTIFSLTPPPPNAETIDDDI